MKHKQTEIRPPLSLLVVIGLLTLATILAAPSEIINWHQYYPWWWTVNAICVYVVSLVGVFGVLKLQKWGFWLSVGSTFAAPLYLRPNDHTLTTIHGALGYVIPFLGLVGVYWYLIIRNWKLFR